MPETLTARLRPCYWRSVLSMRKTTTARVTLWLGFGGLALASCRLQASSVPLGGTHVEEQPAPRVSGRAGPPAVAGSASASSVEASPEPTAASDSQPPPAPGSTGASAAPAAFQLKPYAPHQAWTRLFDLEFALKVGPDGSIDMKMVSHQEARFEVLSMNAGSIDKLQVEYTVYRSTMTIMGSSQDSPEELAGKRFVVSFLHGKPDVRDASGAQPPKKQVDSVKDDAREPLEMQKALKELAQLAASGSGDFSAAGAVALAGGEDEDTKVPAAHARLRQLTTGAHGEKLALVDLGYTLTNAIDDDATIEAQVDGSLSVLDAPARYQTSTLQGPMEIRSADPNGMQGRGTVKITTSYRF